MDLYRELTTAERALDDMLAVTRILRRHFGDTLDVRRLAEDVRRLQAGMHLVQEALAPADARCPRRLEAVPDHEYAPGFFADADDEGVGALRGPVLGLRSEA